MKSADFFKNIHSIYFIGIGGISMSALACICKSRGFYVSGSDRLKNEQTQNMEKMGIKISYIQKSRDLSTFDLVVTTGALKPDNEELISARNQGLQIIDRAEFLHYVSGMFNKTIAVAGTHGKTTTCGMISEILTVAKKQPTFHIGGVCKNFKSNFAIGQNDYFVTEACEYKKSMLHLSPDISVILNIEPDHMDCYKDSKELHDSFLQFANNSKVVVSGLDLNNKSNFISVGNENSNFSAKNIKKKKSGYTFEVVKNGQTLFKAEIKVKGKHNIYNSLCAVAVCDCLKIEKKFLKKGVKNFRGVERRFEVMHKSWGKEIIRDYAHHPTEILSTYKTICETKKKFVFIFQPHTYSRTKYLFDEFYKVLSDIDNLVVYKTYPAREKYISGGSAKDLFKKVKQKNKAALYAGSEKQLLEIVENYWKKKFSIVFVGAGDIGEIAKTFKR